MRAAQARPWGAPATAQRPSSAALAELLGEDAPPTSTVALASRLQSYEDELLKEPYFKTRTARAVGGPRPGDGRELAQLRKTAQNMGSDFQRLLSTHERQEAAALDLRQKVRALRQEVEGRDKALELARRTVERLGADKAQLEAAAAGTQAYVRKLEARLLSVRHAAELEQRCAHMQGELDAAAHALHEAQARAGAAEEAHAAAALDAACLRRGLELAAEQMTRSAGAEIPCTLLRAVARGQEEALSLSGQLADAKQQVQQLTAALEQAREHLQAQQAALASQTGGRQELQQRAEAAEAALEKQRAATAELRRVLDALKPKAGSLAAERDDLRQQLELERTAAADAQKDARQLRAALRQKATIEAALRDELRRALAGEGATPSPLSKQAAVRAASRAGAASRLQQQAAQQAPAKRAGSARPGSKAVMRQTSAWEVPAACSPGAAIAAEPSPLRRLQQQRWHQHGGRAGEPQQEQLEHQRQQQEQASWEELLGTWQPQAGAAGIDIGAARQGDSMLLSPPASSSSTVRRRAAVAPEPAARGPAPAALPAGDGRLMQVYSSALDEQIALLEGDLVHLSHAVSPAKQQRQLAAAGGKRPPAAGGEEAPGHGIGAGRQGAGGGAQQEAPVPNMWHSNPLAGSSPAKLVPRLPVAPAGPQSADQPAETVRARPSAPAAQAHEAASVAAAPAAAEDEWVWGQGSAASSPSLRLPAAPAEAAEQPRLQLLPPQDVQPTDSGGAASLSRHWQLPSPGGENSDWLSNELCEANIEALEVTSSTPLRNPGAGSATSGSGAEQPAQQPAQQQRPASGGWPDSWEEDEGAPGAGDAPASHDAGHLRPQPFLPGLPVVADRTPPPPPGQPAQTLFDLADADFGSDLL